MWEKYCENKLKNLAVFNCSTLFFFVALTLPFHLKRDLPYFRYIFVYKMSERMIWLWSHRKKKEEKNTFEKGVFIALLVLFMIHHFVYEFNCNSLSHLKQLIFGHSACSKAARSNKNPDLINFCRVIDGIFGAKRKSLHVAAASFFFSSTIHFLKWWRKTQSKNKTAKASVADAIMTKANQCRSFHWMRLKAVSSL